MPRPHRIQEPGYVQHVVCRGNDRQPLFSGKSDFLTYLSLLDDARHLYPVKIYNYCLMDNHVHLLVEPEEFAALSKFMEYVTKDYAKYFNKKYDRVGHVFQGRYKSFLVQTERYFFACMRYIDMNPVKAKMAEGPDKYTWSGHQELAHGKNGTLRLDQHDLYRELGKDPGERQIAYRGFILTYQGEELDLLNRRAGILGDQVFKNEIMAKR